MLTTRSQNRPRHVGARLPVEPARRHENGTRLAPSCMTTYRVRKNPRLRSHDYSAPGAYFVTICTSDRRCLFGQITDGEMHLNGLGHLVQTSWAGIGDRVQGAVSYT